MHSLGIVQWDSTRRDHLGYPGRVSGTGLVTQAIHLDCKAIFYSINLSTISTIEFNEMSVVI